MSDSPQREEKSAELDTSAEAVTGRPIADLFPSATVMFADVAGFTAWSSTREPSQVFILLETVYSTFDKVAAKRKVFKVETIGDCYVAVAGLPDPCKDHASVMVKFARDCSMQMRDLTTKLSISLGPDTEDLFMRFGLNSGPVTAGVLRGQKSRFQLFGDTVNVAARMESTGMKGRIHISQSTADELIKLKKGHWVQPRKDSVEVKGKGTMPTYWVVPRDGISSSDVIDGAGNTGTEKSEETIDLEDTVALDRKLELKTERLIEWNTDILARLIRGIVARRKTRKEPEPDLKSCSGSSHASMCGKGLVIDEVQEIIDLPEFDPSQATDSPESVILDPVVLSQLRAYVAAVASTYHGPENPFHNFEQ